MNLHELLITKNLLSNFSAQHTSWLQGEKKRRVLSLI